MAIKTLNEQNMSSGKEEFLREAQVMVKLNHPCIVTLIGICQGPPLMLVCIYCIDGMYTVVRILFQLPYH